MQGVNLGGWFVIERWMTPSLFKDTTARNEFDLSSTELGRRRIKNHHETFITMDDLKWLKEGGVECLRVPIGYWVLGSDDRYVDAAERLDWFMRTSLSLGFKVLLDLHAAPGAQNRAEHSGSGNTVRNKHSTKWLNDISAQDKTIECLKAIVDRYKEYPHLWGIELLNEPAVDLLGLKLVRFYRRAYGTLKEVARPGTRMVFSDGYAPLRLTNCFWLMTDPGFPVIMDCHIYQVFGRRNKRRSLKSHLRRMRTTGWFLRLLSMQQPIIVGEWSAMLPANIDPRATSAYVDAQQSAFTRSEASFYWNYKTEQQGRWNYRHLVEEGLLQ